MERNYVTVTLCIECDGPVVAVVGRGDRVRQAELGRVADERRAQEDAVVEEGRVVHGRHRQDCVAVGQILAAMPLHHALVRAAHVHHLRCDNGQPYNTQLQTVRNYNTYTSCKAPKIVK